MQKKIVLTLLIISCFLNVSFAGKRRGPKHHKYQKISQQSQEDFGREEPGDPLNSQVTRILPIVSTASFMNQPTFSDILTSSSAGGSSKNGTVESRVKNKKKL